MEQFHDVPLLRFGNLVLLVRCAAMNLALPQCPECERLHGIYYDAAMSYMRLYDGSRRDVEETDAKGNQLKTEMQDAVQALYKHQLARHASLN